LDVGTKNKGYLKLRVIALKIETNFNLKLKNTTETRSAPQIKKPKLEPRPYLRQKRTQTKLEPIPSKMLGTGTKTSP
jgi:hypothetical protein